MWEGDASEECRTSPHEELLQMSIQICRGCLSMDATFPVDFSVSQAFTRATGVQWNNGLPRVLCVLCKALVTKCQTFRDKAQCVNDVLMQLMISNDFNLINVKEIKRNELGIKPLMGPRHYPPNYCDLSHDADTFPNEENCVKIEINESELESTHIPKSTHPETYGDLNSPKSEVVSIDQYDFLNEEIDLGVSSIDDGEDVKVADLVDSTTIADDTEDCMDSQSESSTSAVANHSARKLEFQCDNCNSKFKTRVNLTRHISYDDCLKNRSLFKKSGKDLECHTIKRPNACCFGKPHACDICGHGFSHLKDLKRHIRTHTGEKPYVCNSCDRKFSRSDHLQSHMKTHTTKRNVRKDFKSRSVVKKQCVCDVCGFKFSVLAQLKRHMRTHIGDKPRGCDIFFDSTDQYDCLIEEKTDMGESAINDEEDVKVADLVAITTMAESKSVPSMSAVNNNSAMKLEFQCDNCKSKFKTQENLTRHMSDCDFLKNRSLFKRSGKDLKSHTIKKSNVGKPHSCDNCGHGFSHLKDLNRHIRTHTGEKPYVCNSCDHKFSRSDHLRSHMKTHTKNRNVRKDFKSRSVVKKQCVCGVCGFKFSVLAQLKRHMRTHTGEKPHSCNTCGRKFSRLDHLQNHMKTHTEKKTMKCKNFKIPCKKIVPKKHTVCDLCGFKASNLKAHMRTHTGEKPYTCGLCGNFFSHKCALNEHMRTHTGEKPHVCNICSSKFARLQHLNDHMRTHTGEKPHACIVCGFKFARVQHLKKHMRRHTGEKPYTCHLCEKKFSRRYNLQTHVRTHTGEKPYACNDCNYKCDRKKSLRIHIEAHCFTIRKL